MCTSLNIDPYSQSVEPCSTKKRFVCVGPVIQKHVHKCMNTTNTTTIKVLTGTGSRAIFALLKLLKHLGLIHITILSL